MAKSTEDQSISGQGYGMLFSMIRGGQSVVRSGPLLKLLSVGAIGSLALSGCVSGNTSGDKTSAPASSPGSTATAPAKLPAIQSHVFQVDQSNLQVDVLSLARLGSDKLKLQLRITNVGNSSASVSYAFGLNNFSAISLIDGQGMKAYFPLMSTQGKDMESGYPQSSDIIDAGGVVNASIFYPTVPTNVGKVEINSPTCPLFTDIPINGTATVSKGEPDPNQVQLKPPKIENITSSSDDLNGNQSVDQSNNGEAIRLNTDVLFALNKASLSSKAHGILKDVASKIDQAKTTTIKVDGYTDNSGNDAINNPLSRRRAAAVAAALKKLVTRSGVTYETAGHGSSDPVAKNDTAEGRQKNRRVTVTIGK